MHPWARKRGVASAAVDLVCAHLSSARIGTRAVIRAEADNAASIAVALACGFVHFGDLPSPGETNPSGEPVVYATYVKNLQPSP